jgi:S-adenosylmethionine hydrolase
LFPRAAAAIALGKPGVLSDAIEPTAIPEIPAARLAYIDGYGNLKTTIRQGDQQLEPGSRLRVQIGRVAQDAIVSDGSFSVEPNQLAFAPGSSGWTEPGKRRVCWMELFLRSGSAWQLFGRPAVGDQIELHG